MTESEKFHSLDDVLTNLYFEPTKTNDGSYVGVELEFPIIKLKETVNLAKVTDDLLVHLSEKFNFLELDVENKKLHDVSEIGDLISFEHSINTLEFSMGKSLNLLEIKNRFVSYINVVQEFLNRNDCIISGIGMNPNWRKISPRDIVSEYYNVLNNYLKNASDFPEMHKYYDFFSYISSVQTHLDIPYKNMCQTIKLYSFISMIKGSIFSNSIDVTGVFMPRSENCCRDYFYHDSMLTYHKNHVSYYGNIGTIEDLIADMKTRTIYYVKRGDDFVNIPAMTLEQYFNTEKVTGVLFKNNRNISIMPQFSDIDYFRSYKPVELTRRGTIEIRDDCQQPINSCFVPPAFCLGILHNIEEAIDISNEMCSDMKIDYYGGRSNRSMATDSLNPLVNNDTYKNYAKKFVNCAYTGLLKRDRGEERLLVNLMERKNILDCPAVQMRNYMESGKSLDYVVREYSKV